MPVRLLAGFEQKIDGAGSGALTGFGDVAKGFPKMTAFGMRREIENMDYVVRGEAPCCRAGHRCSQTLRLVFQLPQAREDLPVERALEPEPCANDVRVRSEKRIRGPLPFDGGR